jgi:hypothetical protein
MAAAAERGEHGRTPLNTGERGDPATSGHLLLPPAIVNDLRLHPNGSGRLRLLPACNSDLRLHPASSGHRRLPPANDSGIRPPPAVASLSGCFRLPLPPLAVSGNLRTPYPSFSRRGEKLPAG